MKLVSNGCVAAEGVLPVRAGSGEAMSHRRRFAVIAALYLVADIGYSFLFGALNTILLRGGVRLEQLALVNLLGLLYVGRFLVGPVVDRFGFTRLGHYRGWLMLTQLVLVLAWAVLVPLDPVGDLPVVLAVMAVVLAVSAFHDTAMNGLAVRLLAPGDRGVGNGIQAGMASASIVLGSGGALLLYAHAGWGVTVSVLAVLFLLPFVVLIFVPEPAVERLARRGVPFGELVTLFRRRRVLTWTLLVVPGFALGGYVATAVQSPMMLAAHWSLDRIALVQGTLSGVVGLLAGLGAGALVKRYGRLRSAVVVGGFWVVALALLLPLSLGGSMVVVDATAVLAVSAGYSGMAVCVYTVSMDLARPASAATDFTLQISVLGVLRLAMSSAGLALAGTVGFPPLIGASVLLAVLGTCVMARWLRGHSFDTPKELS
ncbi:MFS transporter [Actinomadura sp. 6N118]|uniref:MFS transporter n=1 Tax=Actinomadura sp. 6N118 TaxID=3375151 RepID=UPI0037AAE73C